MPKQDKGDSQLRALGKLHGRALTRVEWDLVKKSLANKFNMVSARAAKIIAENGETSLVPELEALFERAMHNPVKSDPGCLSKMAVIEALDRMECDLSHVYFTAMSHIQMEPVWGTTEDTAGQLRGMAFSALASMGHPETLFRGLPLLFDPESETRQIAVAAFGITATREAELILRGKVLAGDGEPRVIAECFSALLKLDGDRSLAFVADYLNDDNLEVASGAALALGDSRLPSAFSPLSKTFQSTRNSSIRNAILTGIGLLRNEDAIHFLISQIGLGPFSEDETLLNALSVYKANATVRSQIHAAISDLNHARLSNLFRQLFS